MKLMTAKFKFLFLLLIAFSQVFIPTSQPLLSKDADSSLSSEYIRNQDKKNSYIMGPGDILKIEINEYTKVLNGFFPIDGEGFINLKRLNKIYVEGLTSDELAKILNTEYSKYVLNPDVKVMVDTYRIVEVFVDGEVNNPGLYKLDGTKSVERVEELIFIEDTSVKANSSVPSMFNNLFDVLKVAGGVTNNADLTNIEIVRENSFSNGGGKIKTNLNILESIRNNGFEQNIRILDGDRVYVRKSKKTLSGQLSDAIKLNINPSHIEVFIAGKVAIGTSNRLFKIPKKTPLNDAILVAGGPRALSGKIVFVRHSNNDSFDRRSLRLNKKAKPGTYKNPYLQDGDLIYIDRSLYNTASEIITDVTKPFTGIFSTYGLYKAVFN